MNTDIIKRKLNEEYREVFERIEAYSALCGLGVEDTDEALENLADMMLEAQSENKPVSYLIGDDLEAFCDSYFENTDNPATLKGRINGVLDVIRRLVGVICFYSFLKGSNHGVLEDTVDMQSTIIIFVITIPLIMLGWTLLDYIAGKGKKRVLKNKNIKADTIHSDLLMGLVVVIIAAILIGVRLNSAWRWSIELPLIPLLIGTGGLWLVLKLYEAYDNYRTTGRWVKSWGERMMSQEWKDAFEKELGDRFDTENAKRENNHETAYTWDEFMCMIESKYNRLKYILAAVFVAIALLLKDVFVFESTKDIVIYIALFAALGVGFCWIYAIKPAKYIRELKSR